jgi:ATP-dependent DNA ligase
MKLEGIVAKLRDVPYRWGRTESWLKIKCAKRETFPIVGFVPGVGGIAALRLGRREGDLRFSCTACGRRISISSTHPPRSFRPA